MMLAANKKGGNSFNKGNKSPIKRKNGNQRNVNKQNKFEGPRNAAQQGNNPSSPAANKANKFAGNINAHVIKRMIKDINDRNGKESSESDDEVGNEINESQEDEMQSSSISDESDTDESGDEVDMNGSEEEVSLEATETSSEESVTKQQNDSTNQKVKKPLRVAITDPEEKKKRNARSIDITNLPLSIKKAHLEQFYKKYGKIEDVVVRVLGRKSKKMVKAFILFESEEAANKSLETQGMNYKGKCLQVKKRIAGPRDEDNKHSVYVTWHGGVDTGLFVNTVESLFGAVTDIKVARDKKFGFVHFESCDSVELAVATGTVTVGSHVLNIHAAVKKDSTGQPTQSKEKLNIETEEPKQNEKKIQPRTQINKNKVGNQGSKWGEKKQHKVKGGFVQKRRY